MLYRLISGIEYVYDDVYGHWWKEYCSETCTDKDTNLNETEVDTYEKEPEPLIAGVEHAIIFLKGGKSPEVWWHNSRNDQSWGRTQCLNISHALCQDLE